MSVNEELHDAIVRHSILTQQYSNSTVKSVISLIDDKEREIINRLNRDDLSEAQQIRLEAKLSEIRSLSQRLSNDIDNGLRDELLRYAESEAEIFASILDDSLNIKPDLLRIAVYRALGDSVYVHAMTKPYQGETIGQWLAGLGNSLATRVIRSIRDGIAKVLNFRGIIMNIKRVFRRAKHDAETIVRAAIAMISAQARDQTYDANPHVCRYLQWISILDGRTTIQYCVPRDNKLYTLERKPIGHRLPWGDGPGRIHWGCRSSSTIITRSAENMDLDVDTNLPETRPYVAFRSVNDVQLDRPAAKMKLSDYLSALRAAGYDRSEIAYIKRAFLGRVPRSIDYPTFLLRQPRDFIETVLGKKRAALLLDGKLKVDRFYNDNGRLLLLDELRSKYPRIWSRTFENAA